MNSQAPIDATVIYYGNVAKSAEDLASLKGDVLGHFATKDTFISQDMVAGFEAAMTQAGKNFTTHWYEAEDATLPLKRTLAFFKEKLS